MSLDFYLKGPAGSIECECDCGHKHERAYTPTLYERNITHNLAPMARAAGVYEPLWRPDEHGLTSAGQLVERLRVGLAQLEAAPEMFTPLNPSNGWGDYDGLVSFVRETLVACEANPDAKIEVIR